MGSIKGGMGARTDTPFRYGSAGMAKQLVGFAAGTPTARPTAQLSWNTAGDRLPPDCACAAQLHTRNGPQKPAAPAPGTRPKKKGFTVPALARSFNAVEPMFERG